MDLGSLHVSEHGAVRYILYDCLLVVHCKYSSILYHFRDKARYRSKITIFVIPLAFDATVRVDPVGISQCCLVDHCK